MTLLLLALACSDPPAPLPPAPDPRVESVPAAASPRTWSRSLLGVLEPSRDAVLSPRSGGVVTARMVAPGERVVAGQVLLKLDAREAAASYAAAVAALTDAEAVAGQTSRQLDRVMALGESASPAEIDAARVAAIRAEAAADGARARRELAAVALEYLSITAPFDGEVVSLEFEIGETIGPGTPVARVVDAETLTVTVGLNEDELGPAMSSSATFRVRSRMSAGIEAPATLETLSSAADPRTMAWPAELSVPGDAGLAAGAAVEVIAELSAPEADAAVPLRAVDEGAVWLLREGAAWYTPVTVLAERGDQALVEGVAPGDAVIVRGQSGLRDGQRVVALEGSP